MAETRDEILLEGLVCYGYHGVHAEERRLGQRFVVDVVIATSLRDASVADDVHQTISYSAVAKRARAIVEGQPRNLIETVAEEIAGELLDEFPRAAQVTVTLRKPNAPMKGMVFTAAGVRVRRGRERDS
jgi:dihydroneopterin aldolase